MRNVAVTLFCLLVCPLITAASQPSALPPTSATTQGSTIDSDVRVDVVARLSVALRDDYIFPEVGKRAADRLNASLAAGEYERIMSSSAFAAKLSAEIAVIARDKHLSISSMVASPPGVDLDKGIIPSEEGIVRADMLAGGVGYIEVIGFPPLPVFKPTVDKAMSGLRKSRSLIIDARRNMGGSPEAVSYLVSYLIEANHSIEINDIVSRIARTTNFERKRTYNSPTTVSFSGIPVYVLTSKNTFSGGEEFAYDVQAHKLGKVVGEVTGGGANPTGPIDLGHGFVANIPWGRAENPITKTNWEGSGVQPDISVPAPEALEVALMHLGQRPVNDITSASLEQVFAPRRVALPGSEAAAHKFIYGIVSGNPDYNAMTPDFASFNREHLPMLRQAMLLPLGALNSIKFEDVGVMGDDEYRASFAKGAVIVSIALDSERKVAGALVRPVAAGR